MGRWRALTHVLLLLSAAVLSPLFVFAMKTAFLFALIATAAVAVYASDECVKLAAELQVRERGGGRRRVAIPFFFRARQLAAPLAAAAAAAPMPGSPVSMTASRLRLPMMQRRRGGEQGSVAKAPATRRGTAQLARALNQNAHPLAPLSSSPPPLQAPNSPCNQFVNQIRQQQSGIAYSTCDKPVTVSTKPTPQCCELAQKFAPCKCDTDVHKSSGKDLAIATYRATQVGCGGKCVEPSAVGC